MVFVKGGGVERGVEGLISDARRLATQINNQWIVPYNPVLLLKYQCHLNVEYCASIKGVKYLYKYVYKGHTKIEVGAREFFGERSCFMCPVLKLQMT